MQLGGDVKRRWGEGVKERVGKNKYVFVFIRVGVKDNNVSMSCAPMLFDSRCRTILKTSLLSSPLRMYISYVYPYLSLCELLLLTDVVNWSLSIG